MAFPSEEVWLWRQRLLAVLPTPALVLDREGACVFANAAACEALADHDDNIGMQHGTQGRAHAFRVAVVVTVDADVIAVLGFISDC